MEVLNTFPDEYFDLVFVDPPYNLQLNKDLKRPFSDDLYNQVNESWDKFDNFEDYDTFTLSWLSRVKRVMKPNSTMWVCGTYHNIFRIGYLLMNSGFWILNDVIWRKSDAAPNFRGVRFQHSHETLIWVSRTKGSKYFFDYKLMKKMNGNIQEKDIWHIPVCRKPERIKINGNTSHVTQKPERLLQKVILSSSKEGDMILDPFFGTGTTGKVCQEFGRFYVGIEQDENYIEIARRRLTIKSERIF